MQESVFVHKSPTPFKHLRMNQAKSEEEEKERKRNRKDKGQEGDGKAAQQNKNLPEEWKEGLPGQLRLTKLGEEILTSPRHRMWHLALLFHLPNGKLLLQFLSLWTRIC